MKPFALKCVWNYMLVPFDLTYLEDAFQGNRRLVNGIIELFLKQSPDYCDMLENRVKSGNLECLHTVAHTLKSSVQMLGLKDTESLVLGIEKRSKFGVDTSELPGMVFELVYELKRAQTALSLYMSNTDDVSAFSSNVA
jgi:HPt (histidine-containing phosphotransfer) domain-containing protein